MKQTLTREQVYKLIDGERDYQDTRYTHDHSPEEWICYIEDYLAEAKHCLARETDARTKALGILRKVAGLTVAALENNGAPARVSSLDTEVAPPAQGEVMYFKTELGT